MGASLGRITARLAEPTERISTDLIQLINENINPPSEVTEDDVYIRAMYVVSDEVNSFGGCFPVEEHDRLRELLVDSPVIVGHRKDRLPIGRSFHAVVARRDGRLWVKSYFYWLRSAVGAASLAENIDGGIYKECSIGFTFLLPECSVCGKDIRTCEHEPFAQYGGATGEKCHFNYRKIERVLETSLVYRGAIADTAVTRELRLTQGEEHEGANDTERLEDLGQFDPDCEFMVTPAYDGLMVTVECLEGVVTLKTHDGDPLPGALGDRFEHPAWPEGQVLAGQLVAYRGKERMARRHLIRLLEHGAGPATRIELKLYPQNGIDLSALTSRGPDRVRAIRHRIATAAEIDDVARSLMTRDGLHLWTVNALPPDHPGYRYRPAMNKGESGSAYSLTLTSEDGAWLEFNDGAQRRVLRISQFNLSRLMKGARFVTDDHPDTTLPRPGRDTRTIEGAVASLETVDRAAILDLTGGLHGRFALQPIRLDGRRRWIFYRLEGQPSAIAS